MIVAICTFGFLYLMYAWCTLSMQHGNSTWSSTSSSVLATASGSPSGSESAADGDNDHAIECTFVIGIFSVIQSFERRQTIRDTWVSLIHDGSGTDLNTNSNDGHAPCRVIIRFVVGKPVGGSTQQLRSRLETEQTRYGDIIQLDMRENVNQGKTYAWFTYCAMHFPAATYLGKADDDIFIRIDVLQYELQFAPRVRLYGGFETDLTGCGSKGHICPRGWTYMSGQFYFISQDLVQFVAKSLFAAQNQRGHEDIMFGTWLHHANRLLYHMVLPVHTKPNSFKLTEDGPLHQHHVADAQAFQSLLATAREHTTAQVWKRSVQWVASVDDVKEFSSMAAKDQGDYEPAV
jgi:Galactosyltransferase